MKIKDILSIQLDNDIKNVIDLNLQSEDEVKEELDGFIPYRESCHPLV